MTSRSFAPSPIIGAPEHDKVGSARKIHRSLRDHQFVPLDGIQGPGLEVQGHARSLQWIRGVNSLPASETPIYKVFKRCFLYETKALLVRKFVRCQWLSQEWRFRRFGIGPASPMAYCCLLELLIIMAASRQQHNYRHDF